MTRKNGQTRLLRSPLKTGGTLLIIIAAIIAMSSVTFAQVADYTISPENPSPGDELTISGEADANEEVPITVTFEDTTPTTDGAFSYPLDNVNIPDGSESLSLSAQDVTDLDVKVRLPVVGYVSVFEKWITIDNGVASLQIGTVTLGTYDILLTGTSSDDEVTISFEADGIIEADETGHFEYKYDTSSMPEGDYTITVDGISKQLTVGENEEATSSTSNERHGSSSTGTEFKIVPADDGGDDQGVGEDAGTESPVMDSQGNVASTEERLQSTDDPEYVEGTKMEQQITTESTGLSGTQIIGVVVVAFALIALGAFTYKRKIR